MVKKAKQKSLLLAKISIPKIRSVQEQVNSNLPIALAVTQINNCTGNLIFDIWKKIKGEKKDILPYINASLDTHVLLQFPFQMD